MELVAIIIALIVPIGVAKIACENVGHNVSDHFPDVRKTIAMPKSAQALQEMEGIRNINQSGMAHISAWKDGVTRQWYENKPERDYHLYNKFIKDLNSIKKGLESNKKKLN